MKKGAFAPQEQVRFHVELSGMQKATIAASVIFILIIGGITATSPNVHLSAFGLFLELLGTILLGLGLIKTNDELMELASHHEEFNKQKLISHLTKDRFFVVLGIFLIVLGLLLRIISVQIVG